MQKILLLIFFTLIAISCSTEIPKQNAVEKCLSYEPEKVQLTGLLYSKSFPGPPNYEAIKTGDKEEIYWLIKTTNDFCINDTKDNWTGKLLNQSEIQLVIMPALLDLYETKKSLLGKNVVIKGTLFPQMSGHHKTNALITVETIEKANE